VSDDKWVSIDGLLSLAFLSSTSSSSSPSLEPYKAAAKKVRSKEAKAAYKNRPFGTA